MEKRSPSFIRAMLPNFSQRLSLPQAFLKNLTGERLEKAVLVSPLGKWEVKVHGNLNSCLWFGDEGWSEFVSKHGISIGDFIMFEQKTEMVFNVTILDNTACSKSYAALQETNNVEGCAVKSSDQKKNKSNYFFSGQRIIFLCLSSHGSPNCNLQTFVAELLQRPIMLEIQAGPPSQPQCSPTI
ncbi:B3 domain-containing protein REM5-like [Aristolochia californica]|uniref:B3 domain-containing protein REM5-like n=1 Tax=Aristolochia californica TaxID=171875 RepID=UPI0035DC2DAF